MSTKKHQTTDWSDEEITAEDAIAALPMREMRDIDSGEIDLADLFISEEVTQPRINSVAVGHNEFASNPRTDSDDV
jgi:hypothetical protein